MMASTLGCCQSKRRVVCVVLVLHFIAAVSAWSQVATNLAFLGTNSTPFQVDDAFTTAPYSQGNNTLTLNLPFSGGDQLFGVFGSPGSPLSFDWSGAEAIALSLSASVPPPVLLNLEFWASDYSTLAAASVGLGAIGATPTTVVLDFDSGDVGGLNDVAALFFSWGGSSSSGEMPVTIHSIQAVPEPTTWALIVGSGAVLAFLGWSRRCRAKQS